ncbi:MAG: WD40 repeat domain-containing protein [Sulfuricurvum sp.]
MPIQEGLARFDAPVVSLTPLASGDIGIVTENNHIYLYRDQTRSADKRMTLNVPIEKERFFVFDPLHPRLLYGSRTHDSLILIDLERKEKLVRYRLEGQKPTSIAFSPDGNHFACGTDHGRVFLWRNDSDALISRLHSHPEYTSLHTRPKTNFVSAITFNGSEVATSGYGGGVALTNYATHTRSRWYKPSQIPALSLQLYPDRIISGNQDGVLLNIDRHGKRPNLRFAIAGAPIRFLLKIEPDPYLLLSTGDKIIRLIDSKTMRDVHENYIVLEHPITAMGYRDGKLYVATAEGGVHRFDLFPLRHLESLLQLKSYPEAYRYCQQEPLLRQSSHFQTLESIFERIYEKARGLLDQGEIVNAKNLLLPYSSAKSDEINVLLNAFSQKDRLLYLYNNHKWAPFYGLIERFELLKSTRFYQNVERHWSEQFEKAQRLMLTGKEKEAQTLLIPFASVASKRPLIQLLLHHIDTFKHYSKAVHERDFERLHQLTRKHPILRQLSSYAQIIGSTKDLPEKVLEALRTENFDEASFWIREMERIDPENPDSGRLNRFSEEAALLHHALVNKQWRSVYQQLDARPDLLILPWVNAIEEHWQTLIARCEEYAILGDIASIKHDMGPLITLSGRNDRIGDLLRTAYQIQIRALIAQNSAEITVAFARYCEFFGADTEFNALFKQALDRNLPLPELPLIPRKRDFWVQSARRLPERLEKR